jgi:hypothetical protein
MLRVALVAAGQMLLVGILLGLVLVILGHGPWQRWLQPLIIMTVGWGVASYVRARRRQQPGVGR